MLLTASTTTDHYEGHSAHAAVDQDANGIDHRHLAVRRVGAARHQNDAPARPDAPGMPQRGHAFPADGSRIETGRVDAGRDGGDALGRNAVALLDQVGCGFRLGDYALPAGPGPLITRAETRRRC